MRKINLKRTATVVAVLSTLFVAQQVMADQVYQCPETFDPTVPSQTVSVNHYTWRFKCPSTGCTKDQPQFAGASSLVDPNVKNIGIYQRQVPTCSYTSKIGKQIFYYHLVPTLAAYKYMLTGSAWYTKASTATCHSTDPSSECTFALDSSKSRN